MTTHNGALFGVERGLLENMAHYVDGIPLVGGRGIPLQELLDESYRREADALMGDLDRLTSAMHQGDRDKLAERLGAMGRLIAGPPQPRQEAAGPDGTAPFTADYSNGGKPITGEHDKVPAPPVLEDAEGQPDADDGDGPHGRGRS
jgi:hypothetical protein